MEPQVLLAPAKLTRTLRITGVRDDGYHLIDAEMVTLELADSLVVSAGDGLEIREASGLSIPVDGSNLVSRALDLAGRTAHVELTKRIPAGAGLGGGSADAAAILRWAGVDDLDAAAGLGADVAFCLVGGRARVRGIGELVEPLPHVDLEITLLTPPFGCSTPAVYAAWDAMGGPTADGPNDLEPAALRVEPRLAEYRDRLGDATGRTPVLAGSGSTWFVDGAFPGEGRVVTRTDRPRGAAGAICEASR
ncbi:MAG: 4-(cytidine 5'-diphospho)-2-C-methyl-D-erythritol kinase [Acidimicrobiales bacterium]